MVHDVKNDITAPCKLFSIRTRTKLIEILPSTLKDSKRQTVDCPVKTTTKIIKLVLFSQLSKMAKRWKTKVDIENRMMVDRGMLSALCKMKLDSSERRNVHHDTSVG